LESWITEADKHQSQLRNPQQSINFLIMFFGLFPKRNVKTKANYSRLLKVKNCRLQRQSTDCSRLYFI